MKIKLSYELPPAFNQLIREPGRGAYSSIAVVAGLIILIWMLFSSFDIRDVNGWLPYHAPVSIFLSLVLLVLALRSWIKMLLGGETAASLAEEDPQRQPGPVKRPRMLKSLFRSPPRVLVADDDPCVRMVLCKKLSALGARATAVSDGLEALLAVADRPWDLVLMDGEMPFMDGIEATRQIRDQRLLPARTPIVAISSNRELSYRQQCLAAGMTAYRVKPRNTEDLEALLDEFLVMREPDQRATLEGSALS